MNENTHGPDEAPESTGSSPGIHENGMAPQEDTATQEGTRPEEDTVTKQDTVTYEAPDAGTANPPATPPAASQGPRVGTIVWGLVVLAVGLGVLAATAGARIDVSFAAILLLGGAGIALVAGSIVSSFRRRNEP
ncbi:hypothetical protein [Myceligenerans indicum]|uniref:MFS transporter n=1 Tax=Myceligenerans indicum TaxID=2593663 RepID=A0ABS1LEI1_9MICO|nr:hypothetical protein [Myceligenerans indicum]MBL0884700.1 MFS transporter [Myceligenerans indicum]